jgi:hypothetical protein
MIPWRRSPAAFARRDRPMGSTSSLRSSSHADASTFGLTEPSLTKVSTGAWREASPGAGSLVADTRPKPPTSARSRWPQASRVASQSSSRDVKDSEPTRREFVRDLRPEPRTGEPRPGHRLVSRRSGDRRRRVDRDPRPRCRAARCRPGAERPCRQPSASHGRALRSCAS